MNEYSEEANAWVESMRDMLKDRIKSYSKLPEEERKKYSTLREHLIWPPEKQERYGYPGPIEFDVFRSWGLLKPKVRKEFGGKKSEAANIVAVILRDEFGVDIVDEVRKHAEPCYGIHDRVVYLDWDLEQESGYKKLATLTRHKDLDQGSALQLYWGFSPEFYTQFGSTSDIKDGDAKKAFRLLKALEARLLANDFKTNVIPFKPLPEGGVPQDAKWQIPEVLTHPNIQVS